MSTEIFPAGGNFETLNASFCSDFIDRPACWHRSRQAFDSRLLEVGNNEEMLRENSQRVRGRYEESFFSNNLQENGKKYRKFM